MQYKYWAVTTSYLPVDVTLNLCYVNIQELSTIVQQ